MGQNMNIGSENDVRDLSCSCIVNSSEFSLQGTIYYLIKFSLIIDSLYPYQDTVINDFDF